MIKLKNYLYLLLLSLIFLISCSEEKVNIKNSGKTNFYEHITRFKNQYFNSEILDIKDNAGYIFPVVFLDIDEYILCSKDNKVIYIKGRRLNKELQLNEDEILSNKPIIYINNINIDNKSKNSHNILLSFIDGTFKSYDLNFKLLWKSKINLSKFALINEPLILNTKNPQIIISNTDGLIQSYNFKGDLNWTKQFNSNIYKTLITDNNSNLYVVQAKKSNLLKDTIFVLNKNGEFVRNISVENGGIVKYPVISNNRIYFMTNINNENDELSNLYCFDLNFKLIFKKEFNLMLRHLSINSQNQQIFVVTYKSGLSNISNGVFCFDNNGVENWHLYFDYSIPYPVLVSKNEICFTVSNQNTVGIFYMDIQKGILTNVISAGKLPDFNLEPSVNYDGSLMFTCTESKSLIKIDETPLNKMLPY